MEHIQDKMESPVGTLYITATANGISGIYTEAQKNVPFANKTHPLLQAAKVQLKEYFAGKRKKFDLAFDLQGTPFQLKVWKKLYEIPFGETRSYQDIAKSLRQPKACRAVGNANGKNPICIVIPCHRVITSGGKLGGYSSGLAMKKTLLKIEGIDQLIK